MPKSFFSALLRLQLLVPVVHDHRRDLLGAGVVSLSRVPGRPLRLHRDPPSQPPDRLHQQPEAEGLLELNPGASLQ